MLLFFVKKMSRTTGRSRVFTPAPVQFRNQARVVIADLESPWRADLVGALQEHESTIRVTDNGTEVCRTLEEVTHPPRIIVIGQSLRGIGGLEALYQADRMLAFEKKERPSWPTRTVSLITDVRSDAELLDLYRRRGVTHFIYREDPLEKTIGALLANLRPASRAMVRIDATAGINGKALYGAIYDLSVSGARLVIDGVSDEMTPSVGRTFPLQLSFRHNKLRCKAEVRGLTTKNASQGKRLILGVQFVGLDAASVDMVECMIRDASEEFEMANSESVITSSITGADPLD